MLEKKLKSIFKGVKVIAPKDLGEDAIYNIVCNLLISYNLELNIVDFDCKMIYKRGYQYKEVWDDDYVMSFTIVSEHKYTVDTEDEEIELWEFAIEC